MLCNQPRSPLPLLSGCRLGRTDLVRNLTVALTFCEVSKDDQNGATHMPILLWLIGVPLSLVLVLMLAGVIHF